MKEPVTLGRDDPLAEPDHLADDATLIARSRTEPEAFAAIFDRHATEIHRYAARRLGPVRRGRGRRDLPGGLPAPGLL